MDASDIMRPAGPVALGPPQADPAHRQGLLPGALQVLRLKTVPFAVPAFHALGRFGDSPFSSPTLSIERE